MNIVDWRHVDARGLALVYARERARWLIDLGWETRESWTHIEQARATWGLPGLAAIDDSGRVRGLTFFHATGGRFDVGGVFAESAAVRESLLDAAINVCEEAEGEEVVAFLYTAGFSFTDVLEARGFALDHVDYLVQTTDRASEPQDGNDGAVTLCDWTAAGIDALSTLLDVSYDAAAAHRFVPHASRAGWRHYVGAMVDHNACGSVLPSITRIAMSGETCIGAVLVTDLGPATAHVAQLAVHPEWRRQGLAGHLLDEATQRARAAGYARITLLASATNHAAQSLYRDRGYVKQGGFLSATKPLPVRAAAQAS